jgi:hypothetical protein
MELFYHEMHCSLLSLHSCTKDFNYSRHGSFHSSTLYHVVVEHASNIIKDGAKVLHQDVIKDVVKENLLKAFQKFEKVGAERPETNLGGSSEVAQYITSSVELTEAALDRLEQLDFQFAKSRFKEGYGTSLSLSWAATIC